MPISSARLRGVRLQNYMRLAEVDLDFRDDGVVLVSGANEQGKTTLVDAIWDALTGIRRAEPIKTGADAAELEVRLEIETERGAGEIVVQRKVKKRDDGSQSWSLNVTNGEGLKYQRPQELLDSLWTAISVDPLAWVELGLRGAEGRRKQVRQLVAGLRLPTPARLESIARGLGLPPFEPGGDPLDNFDAVLSFLTKQRAEHAREEKRLAAEVATYADASETQAVDVSALLARQRALRQAAEATAVLRRLERDREGEAHDAECKLREAETALAVAKGNYDAAIARRDEAAKKVAAEPTQDAPETLDEAIAGATAQNLAADRWQRATKLRFAHDNAKIACGVDASRIAHVEELRDGLFASASLPAGLKLDPAGEGFLYKGVPFPDQASGEERISVSVEVAKLSSPVLKLFRIRDGNKLDTRHMRTLEEAAAKAGVDVIIEYVDETGTRGIVIDDGRVIADKR